MENKKFELEDFVGERLSQILSRLLASNKVSLTTLSRHTGIPIPTIKRLQSGTTSNPTITTLMPIAKFFGVSVMQLIGTQALPENTEGYVEQSAFWLKVPLMGWTDVVKLPNTGEKNNFVWTDVEVGETAYALRVEESDWIGFLKDSILIIDPTLNYENKDYVVVSKIGTDTVTLKQVLIDEDKIYLKSLSPHIQPILIDKKDYQFFGVLVQVKKKLRG